MKARRTLLIGWDAADWKLIRPLMDSGGLPALQTLMNRGVHGNLRTLRPILSPTLWTSIATGKRPYKHGILGFSEPDLRHQSIRPVTNLSRRSKAIWNILNQEGFRSNVIGWWPSHPAEPINGVMVSNHYPDPSKDRNRWPLRQGTVHPPDLAEALAAYRLHPQEVTGDTLLPFVPRAPGIDPDKDSRLGNLAKLIAETSCIHNAATACMQLEDWDFMAVYYVGIDHFGHSFMRYHPPRQEGISEDDFALYSGVMAGAYHFMDMLLSTLLKIAGDDSNVLLVSDHGFHPDHLRPPDLPNAPAGPAAEHRELGIFVAAGPDFKQGGGSIHSASLLDVTPSLLHIYGLPVGADMDGKVLLNAFSEERPVKTIPSWESVEGDSGCHPEDRQIDSRDAEESIQQLVDLGYIDPPDADRALAIRETIRELDYNKAQSLMDGKEFSRARAIASQLWDEWPDENRFGILQLQCDYALGDPVELRCSYELLCERGRAAAAAARQELKLIAEAEASQDADGPMELSRKERLQRHRVMRRAHLDRDALCFYEARVLSAEGRYGEAKTVLCELVDTWPARQQSIYRELGVLCLKESEAEPAATEAIQWLEKARAVDPEDYLTELHLARAFARKRYDMDAAAHALASLQLQFFSPVAHFEYGRALVRIGHLKWGQEALEEAARQSPGMAEAHDLLAWLFDGKLAAPERARKHRELAEAARAGASAHEAEPSGVAEDNSADARLNRLAQKIEALPSRQGAPLAVPPGEMITIVTGLPRSGTSLAMQLLSAAGIEAFTDGKRVADPSNAKGYFEHERVKRMASETDRSWLSDARGQAIKIVVPLVKTLPSELNYRIIFMDRAVKEIFESQQRMLTALGKTAPVTRDPDGVATMFLRQSLDSWMFLRDLPKATVLRLSYNHFQADPAEQLDSLADFLGVDSVARSRMEQVFSSSLYHVRLTGKV